MQELVASNGMRLTPERLCNRIYVEEVQVHETMKNHIPTCIHFNVIVKSDIVSSINWNSIEVNWFNVQI